MKTARRLRVDGIVQGVGFRAFVHRLAEEHGVAGCVFNAETGVEIHAEAAPDALDRFADAIRARPPSAARIARMTIEPVALQNLTSFEIRGGR